MTIYANISSARFICDLLGVDPTDQQLLQVEAEIYHQMDNAFKLIKNIQQTSLNDNERINRLIEAESKYGIPKTHLL